ncbi:MAG TPA: hypothetical protein VEG30_18165 [Terriglobales bacterium]|nr:hypothetical protein [Terriglobales bacterium]
MNSLVLDMHFDGCRREINCLGCAVGGYFVTLGVPQGSWVRRHWVAVLFLFAALLVTLIVDRQGQTISSQQMLIKTLFLDSLELTAVKTRNLEQQREKAQAEMEAAQGETAQDASPEAEAPAKPKQANPGHDVELKNRAKRQTKMPPRDLESEPRVRWVNGV